MSGMTVPILAFLLVTIFAALGVHIAIAMGIIGLASTIYYLGLGEATSLAGISAWFNIARFSIAMIPLFVLMGTLCDRAGVGTDAYKCFYTWLSRIKGSLAMVTVVSCAAFAALTGSSTATVATIGGISLPEMRNKHYAKTLRLGCIAASGTLGILIPPSVIFIFYGVLTEVSIGRLFIAGIIPGIFTVIMFSALIYAWVTLYPEAAPMENDERFTLKEKIYSLTKILPVLLVFIVVTISIYQGVCSPEEAAAYGVLAIVVVTAAMGRLTWVRFKLALDDALRISGFIVLILMAALLFANSIALSGFSTYLNGFVTSLNAPPFVIMLVIVGIYLVLGCVLDTFGLMVLTVPIFFPLVTHLGYDPVWFGVIVTIMVECALITPPIGTNIYVTQSLDSEATSLDVIRGILPFLVIEIVLVMLLIAFPSIALWLPSRMM